jgi:acetyl esterase/lipase
VLLALVLVVAAVVAVVLVRRDEGPAAPTILRDQTYRGHGGTPLLLDLFLPGGDETDRAAVLVLHGGSWRGGDKRDLESIALGMARAGFVAVNVNYSLDAKPAFPAELIDVQAAIRWVRDNAEEHGIDPRRVGAMGVSAGGQLAALAGAVGTGPLTDGVRLGAVVSWSAPMNLLALTGYAPPPASILWNLVLVDVLGCPGATCPERYVAFSPVTHVTADDSPMLLVNSLADPSVPYLQTQAMADRLRVAGVPVQVLPVPGSSHGGYADQALIPSVAFLKAQLDRLAG